MRVSDVYVPGLCLQFLQWRSFEDDAISNAAEVALWWHFRQRCFQKSGHSQTVTCFRRWVCSKKLPPWRSSLLDWHVRSVDQKLYKEAFRRRAVRCRGRRRKGWKQPARIEVKRARLFAQSKLRLIRRTLNGCGNRAQRPAPVTIVREKDSHHVQKSSNSARYSAQEPCPRYAEISPASISKYIDGFRQLAVHAHLHL